MENLSVMRDFETSFLKKIVNEKVCSAIDNEKLGNLFDLLDSPKCNPFSIFSTSFIGTIFIS